MLSVVRILPEPLVRKAEKLKIGNQKSESRKPKATVERLRSGENRTLQLRVVGVFGEPRVGKTDILKR